LKSIWELKRIVDKAQLQPQTTQRTAYCLSTQGLPLTSVDDPLDRERALRKLLDAVNGTLEEVAVVRENSENYRLNVEALEDVDVRMHINVNDNGARPLFNKLKNQNSSNNLNNQNSGSYRYIHDRVALRSRFFDDMQDLNQKAHTELTPLRCVYGNYQKAHSRRLEKAENLLQNDFGPRRPVQAELEAIVKEDRKHLDAHLEQGEELVKQEQGRINVILHEVWNFLD
jgi:hypothetical protein